MFGQRNNFWNPPQQLQRNVWAGKTAENRSLGLDTFKNVVSERKHKGRDFEKTTHASTWSPKGVNHVERNWDLEVKNGGGRLSKAQKARQKKKGKNYEVERFDF